MKKMVGKMKDNCFLYEWEDFNFGLCANKLGKPIFIQAVKYFVGEASKEDLNKKVISFHPIKKETCERVFGMDFEKTIQFLYQYFYF